MKELEINAYHLGDFIYKIKFIILIFLIIGYLIGIFISKEPVITKSGNFKFDLVSTDIKELNDLVDIAITNNLVKKLNRVSFNITNEENTQNLPLPTFVSYKSTIDFQFLLDTLSSDIYSDELKILTASDLKDQIDYNEALETLSSINFQFKNKETAKSRYFTFLFFQLDTNLSEKDFKILINQYFNNLTNSINKKFIIRVEFFYDKQQAYNKKIKNYLEMEAKTEEIKNEISINRTKTISSYISEIDNIISTLSSSKPNFLNDMKNNLDMQIIRLISLNSLKINYSSSAKKDRTTILISLVVSLILSFIIGYIYYKYSRKRS